MNILNKKNNRHLTILELLSEKKRSLNYLTKKLSITEATLLRDISDINHLYYPIKIIFFDDTILNLVIPRELSFSKVYAITLENSLEFNILETIFFDESHTYLTLASELDVSEATIKRKIGTIRKAFKENQLDMDITTKPLKVTGNEKTITEFFIAYFKERYAGEEYPFSSSLTLKTTGVCTDILTLFSSVNYGDLHRICLWTMVNVIREQNGHPMTQYFPKRKQTVFWDHLENFVEDKDLHKILSHGIPINVLERTFHLFSSLKYAFNETMMFELCQLDENNQKRYESVQRYITELAKKFRITLSEEKKAQLTLKFFNRIALFENSIMPGRMIDNYPERFVKQNRWINPKNFAIIREVYADCFPDEKLQTPYFQYEAFYSTILLWQGLYQHLLNTSQKIRIGLAFDAPKEYPNFVSKQLAFYFNDRIDTHILTFSSIKEIKNQMKQYDYLLTNIPFSHEEANIICVEKTINLSDFIQIFELIYQLMSPSM